MFPLQKKPDPKKKQAAMSLMQDMKKPAAQSKKTKARARAAGKMC